MKILHRIRGKTGKRCLSFLLAFAMLIGLIPVISPGAQAAQASAAINSTRMWVDADGLLNCEFDAYLNNVTPNVDGVYASVQFYDVCHGTYLGWLGLNESKSRWTPSWRVAPERAGAHSYMARLWINGASQDYWSQQFSLTSNWQPPNYLRNVKVVAGNGTLTYSWDRPSDADLNGNTFQNIQLDFRTADTNGAIIYQYFYITDRNQTSYTVTGLENGRYYWTYLNLSYVRNGIAAATVHPMEMGVHPTAKPELLPSAPELISVAPGYGSLTLNWKRPTSNAQYVDQYDVLINGGRRAIINDRNATSCTITGLVVGAPYRVQIRAFSNELIAYSPYSNEIWMAPQVVAPAPPAVTVQPGAQQNVISWSVPNSNGGTIQKYHIYRNGVFLTENNAMQLSYSDTGLTNGQTYTYNVYAYNEAGWSVASATVSGTPRGIPFAPTLNSATGTTVSGQVRLNWTTPNNNGAPITAIEVLRNGQVYKTYSQDQTPDSWTGAMVTAGQAVTATVTGLTDGDTGQYTVRAVNAAGNGAVSNMLTATSYRLPDVPTSLKVTNGVRELTLNWTPGFNGGNAVSKYNVYASAKTPKNL